MSSGRPVTSDIVIRPQDPGAGQSFFEKSIQGKHIALGNVKMRHLSQDLLDEFAPIGSIVQYVGGYFTNSSNGGFTITEAAGNNFSSVNNALSENWRVCDGTQYSDPESPIFGGAGRYLPNMDNDRFLMGSTSAGSSGGTNNDSHSHGLAGALGVHGHTSGDIRFSWDMRWVLGQNVNVIVWHEDPVSSFTPSRTARFNLWSYDGWGDFGPEYTQTTVHTGGGWINTTYAQSAGSTGSVNLSHSHGSTSSLSLDNRPQYLSCFYLMRVK